MLFYYFVGVLSAESFLTAFIIIVVVRRNGIYFAHSAFITAVFTTIGSALL